MLLYLLGILIVLVGLAVSIGLHEIGHLIPAKLFGVKVTQYMVGFGKTLWSRKKGETEYGVKAIPLGGYIAMTGMYPPQKPGEAPRASTTGFLNSVVEEGPLPSKRTRGDAGDAAGTTELVLDADAPTDLEPRRGIAGIVDDARLASAETIESGEEHRAFYQLPAWKRIIIMLGGPVMNLLLAFVFFGIVLVGFGVPQPSTTLGQVSECLIPAGSTETSCSAGDPAAPAAAAGLLPGDTILSVNGSQIDDWEQFRERVAAAPGQTLQVEIDRDGRIELVSLTPAANARALVDADGTVLTDADGTVRTESVGMVGATPANEMVSQPLSEVPAYVGENVARVAGVVIQLPQRMVDTWNAAFGAEERDPNGPMSVVGVGRIAGEIVSLDEAPVAARAQTVIGLLGSLNIALFVFNLLPLMPLDGGHVIGAIYEALKRGFAKLRGKPDPGPVDTAKMVPITFVVVVVLGAMTALLVYADLVKPVSLF
ncbi:RIP metalloprotease RseP [Leucobacter luti]|uniref:RIP metalloprotease RseP n=1 Tax=Leucobacter luti TaxID=340320 RepID=A0A4Q7U5B8_9MICO|nr:PDZ domain-containing protein [Leucobacter luti]RZT68623.1 RIP metalloprotease RseP [Leucobacter luti]